MSIIKYTVPRITELNYGIEICHDRLTRFVDQISDSIGGIAAGIDGVSDYDFDLSRFHNEASLG